MNVENILFQLFIHSFHSFIILTDLTNNEECEVYHKCFVDDNYYQALKIMFKNCVFINSIRSKNVNKYTIFKYGMCGTTSYENLYKKK